MLCHPDPSKMVVCFATVMLISTVGVALSASTSLARTKSIHQPTKAFFPPTPTPTPPLPHPILLLINQTEPEREREGERVTYTVRT